MLSHQLIAINSYSPTSFHSRFPQKVVTALLKQYNKKIAAPRFKETVFVGKTLNCYWMIKGKLLSLSVNLIHADQGLLYCYVIFNRYDVNLK